MVAKGRREPFHSPVRMPQTLLTTSAKAMNMVQPITLPRFPMSARLAIKGQGEEPEGGRGHAPENALAGALRLIGSIAFILHQKNRAVDKVDDRPAPEQHDPGDDAGVASSVCRASGVRSPPNWTAALAIGSPATVPMFSVAEAMPLAMQKNRPSQNRRPVWIPAIGLPRAA